MRPFNITFLICALSLSVTVHSDEVTTPVVDDMMLELGEGLQQIKVRAMSMGPGGCGVEFRFAGESAGFLAPPGMWSPWESIGPAISGPTTHKLGFSPVCSTGAIAEVNYHK